VRSPADLQKNSISIDLMLNTIRLFARVTKASRGKIKTAPMVSVASMVS